MTALALANALLLSVAPMQQARLGHTATLLQDGRVLVTGGCAVPLSGSTADRYICPAESALSSTELFDPTENRWTSGPTMAGARFHHGAFLLPDGRVLVLGGNAPGARATPVEIFDPRTGTLSVGANTPRGFRSGHRPPAGASLPDGRLLVLSGDYEQPPAIFDPKAGGWTLANGFVKMHGGGARIATLPDGRLAVNGGYFFTMGTPVSSLHVFDPKTGAWTRGKSMAIGRAAHASVMLSDGRLLIAGGHRMRRTAKNGAAWTRSAEVWDPATKAWKSAGALNERKDHPFAITLPNGGALVLGGATDHDTELSLSVERWDPATARWKIVSSLQTGRVEGQDTATLLADGRLLLLGGESSEVLDPRTGTSEVGERHTTNPIPLLGAPAGCTSSPSGDPGLQLWPPVRGAVRIAGNPPPQTLEIDPENEPLYEESVVVRRLTTEVLELFGGGGKGDHFEIWATNADGRLFEWIVTRGQVRPAHGSPDDARVAQSEGATMVRLPFVPSSLSVVFSKSTPAGRVAMGSTRVDPLDPKSLGSATSGNATPHCDPQAAARPDFTR